MSHPPLLPPESGGVAVTHLPEPVSQVKPAAHWLESAHWLRQPPNAGSQTYGAQSKDVVGIGQLEPAALQYDEPMPSVGLVHLLGAHWLPPAAGTHLPPTPHVCEQLPGPPQSPRGSVPTGTTVQIPGVAGSAHE
jgi:hypothetical protein